MRVLKKIVVFLLVFSSVLLIVAFSLARIFEDDLEKFVVEEMNRHLRVEIQVEHINLSFIKKFPDASLEFRNVFIPSVLDFEFDDFSEINTDTLLMARQVFLRFNLAKLVKREYFIKEVQVQSGELNIYIDRKGIGNYLFWGKTESLNEKNFLLALDNVNLSNIDYRFDNRALKVLISGTSLNSYFKGQFSRESYSMNAGIDGKLNRYTNEGTVLLKDQNIRANASLSVDPQSIRISEGNLELAGQHMLVSGSILRPKPFDLDLQVEGRRLDLEQLLKHIVLFSEKFPEDLKAGGELSFKGNVSGMASNTRMPMLQADFSIAEGWIQTSNLPWELISIITDGSYSNGKRQCLETTEIRLQDMSMRFGSSRIGGDYSVSNLISPTFNYNIKTDLDLSDIQQIKRIDSMVNNIQGRFLAEIQMEGNQDLLKNLRKEDLLNYKYNANIRIDDIELKTNRIPFELKGFSGNLAFTDHLEIINLSGELEDNQISMSGRVDNFLEYLVTPGGNLWMDIDLYSERLDLNHLRTLRGKRESEGLSNKSAGAETVLLPKRLYLKTRFWFDDLEIKDFRASNVTGNLIYKPQRLSINHIELTSMEGRIQSEGMLEQRQDMSFLVRAMSRINSVDITQAFTSFNNFGQEFIVDNHLKGSLSGEVNFSAGMDPGMRIRKETILADCDVIIKNGELSGFEPMMSLSKYIDVEELENISFSTLNNEIFIRNQEVLIPKMDIYSSAVDITASGIHGFNKEFTYKIKLALSELLAKKSRKPENQESEFGVIEDDGLGRMYIYLIIEGSPGGTDVRYDRRGAVQNVREQMKEEKQELKMILKEEFGLFKKDSSLIIEDTKEQPPDFIIEWEEKDSAVGIAGKPDNKSEGERFIIVWDEEEETATDSIPSKRRKRRKKIN